VFDTQVPWLESFCVVSFHCFNHAVSNYLWLATDFFDGGNFDRSFVKVADRVIGKTNRWAAIEEHANRSWK
jgi:hypothetical protein